MVERINSVTAAKPTVRLRATVAGDLVPNYDLAVGAAVGEDTGYA